MNITNFEVEGLQELERQLVALGGKDGLTALRRASREAMKPVKRQMEETAPFNENKSGNVSENASKNQIKAATEHVKDSISISSRALDKKGGRQTALAVRVGPHRAHSQKVIAAEYGTQKQQAAPFMRPALHDNVTTVLNTMKTRLALEIEKITRKNAR